MLLGGVNKMRQRVVDRVDAMALVRVSCHRLLPSLGKVLPQYAYDLVRDGSSRITPGAQKYGRVYLGWKPNLNFAGFLFGGKSRTARAVLLPAKAFFGFVFHLGRSAHHTQLGFKTIPINRRERRIPFGSLARSAQKKSLPSRDRAVFNLGIIKIGRAVVNNPSKSANFIVFTVGNDKVAPVDCGFHLLNLLFACPLSAAHIKIITCVKSFVNRFEKIFRMYFSIEERRVNAGRFFLPPVNVGVSKIEVVL